MSWRERREKKMENLKKVAKSSKNIWKSRKAHLNREDQIWKIQNITNAQTPTTKTTPSRKKKLRVANFQLAGRELNAIMFTHEASRFVDDEARWLLYEFIALSVVQSQSTLVTLLKDKNLLLNIIAYLNFIRATFFFFFFSFLRAQFTIHYYAVAFLIRLYFGSFSV